MPYSKNKDVFIITQLNASHLTVAFLSYDKNKNVFIITSSAHFRQRVIKKSYKSGVTFASNYYHVSRNVIYEWRHKWDGTVKSLRDRSHRPHHHPNEHTESEKEMILKRYPYYKDDMMMLWDSLRKDDYARCYNSLVRVINKRLKPEKKKSKETN